MLEKTDKNYTETSRDKALLHYITYAMLFNVNHKSSGLVGEKEVGEKEVKEAKLLIVT